LLSQNDIADRIRTLFPEWATPEHVILHVQFSSGVTVKVNDGEHFARSWCA